MDLKGRTAAWVAGNNARVSVWYEEEAENGGSIRTCYTGTVTACEPKAHGLRVWFDGLTSSEQEWVDGSDEWAWLDEDPADSTAGPLSAVRLRLLDPSIGGALCCRLLGNDDSAGSGIGGGRLAGKRARIAAAAGAMPPSVAPSPRAPVSRLSARQQAVQAAATAAASSPAAADSGTAARSSQRRKPEAPAGGRGVAGAMAQAPPPPRPMTSTMCVSAAGVALQLPAAQATQALRSMAKVAPPYPPSEADKYGLCDISGLPARYYDPLVGKRYGSADAFRQLRNAHAERVGGNAGE